MFAIMFPDSCIAKSMSCYKTKIRYMITFGCAPCFHQYSQNELNCVLYLGQNDFLMQFWNESKKLADTWYLISEFLQGKSVEQLDVKFDDAVATLDQSKLIQISSHAPNVNFKALKIIADQWEFEWSDS